tara:strand:- start:3453 stop:3974 length:522 start_codon:yes stop_codon:yes gene_type:complete
MNLLEYIIYNPLPEYFYKSQNHNSSLGWKSTDLTPDDYDTNIIKPGHCGFKHLKEITIPKIEKIKDTITGFYIIEGDVTIHLSYEIVEKINLTRPTWLGYKKKLSNYIVGNFLIYIPITHFQEFKELLNNQKQLIYSDRFFTKLYQSKWLDLFHKSLATEIPHYSNVLGNFRK